MEQSYESLNQSGLIQQSLPQEQDCDDNDDNSPATLGLENMRGVFILVGVGIVGGLGLIIIEIIYKKHQMKKKSRTSMARVAIEKWRGTLSVRLLFFVFHPHISFIYHAYKLKR